MAYASIEPFGERRADLRASVLARLAAMGPRKRRDGRPWDLEDFGLVEREGAGAPKAAGWQALKAVLTADLPVKKGA